MCVNVFTVTGIFLSFSSSASLSRACLSAPSFIYSSRSMLSHNIYVGVHFGMISLFSNLFHANRLPRLPLNSRSPFPSNVFGPRVKYSIFELASRTCGTWDDGVLSYFCCEVSPSRGGLLPIAYYSHTFRFDRADLPRRRDLLRRCCCS